MRTFVINITDINTEGYNASFLCVYKCIKKPHETALSKLYKKNVAEKKVHCSNVIFLTKHRHRISLKYIAE